jgi:Tol biopolymer transport system component
MRANPGWAAFAPDGTTIAFHSNPDGNGDILVVPADGGKPRNLTAHPATDTFPTFSRDGQWIYFASTRSGRSLIWRLPAAGGEAVPLDIGPTLRAIEDPGGRYLYYVAVDRFDVPGTLMRAPIAGGPPEKIADGLGAVNFDVVAGGVYYLSTIDGQGRLIYLDLASRQPVVVADKLGAFDAGMDASDDGRFILFSRVDSTVSDLMLVDGFR